MRLHPGHRAAFYTRSPRPTLKLCFLMLRLRSDPSEVFFFNIYLSCVDQRSLNTSGELRLTKRSFNTINKKRRAAFFIVQPQTCSEAALSDAEAAFGGVFCYNNSQEQEQDMVSRALVPLQQQQLKGSYVLPPKPGVCVLAFSFEKPFDFEITEGLTRRVLQDIGNMVAERAVEVKLQAQPIARLLLGAVSMLVLLLKGTLL
ncbi:hypothetical protein SO802_003574, partial [Lithocarpus litseifolius]